MKSKNQPQRPLNSLPSGGLGWASSSTTPTNPLPSGGLKRASSPTAPQRPLNSLPSGGLGWAFILLLTIATTKAQNLTLKVTNNATPATTNTVNGQASLQVALTQSGVALTNIKKIEITAGTFTTADWNYLKNNRGNLNKLSHFNITNTITAVADIPNSYTPYFSIVIESITVHKVERIGSRAFEGLYWLITANFPMATSIGSRAFSGCVRLTTANIPMATSIGFGAFVDCSKLTTANFPMATSIGVDVFKKCSNLTTVNFPMATSIGGEAFYHCSNLTTANIPMATSIGDSAFKKCSNLTTANIPMATSIREGAFNRCYSLTTANFPMATSIREGAFKNCYKLTTANIPKATSIGNDAFNGCSNLTTANIPKATSIGNDAFNGCSKLTTANFPKATSIGLRTFNGCSNLTTANFPMATSIGGEAFYRCNLTTANFPMATSIGEAAFYRCNLTTANFPMATSIGSRAFYRCEDLTTANFPKVTSIKEKTFEDCVRLTKANFPMATSIGSRAFWYCSNLTKLVLDATPPTTVGNNAFLNVPSQRSLIFVDTNGTPLTGTTLTTAKTTYKAVNDGNTNDNLWHGWKINDTHYKLTKVNTISNSGTVTATDYFKAVTTITLQRKQGYYLAPNNLKVYKTGNTNTTVPVTYNTNTGVCTFIMPAYNTTVEASYIPAIEFQNISKTYGDANFNLNAISNANKTISYTIVSGTAVSLSGTNNQTVSIQSAGTVKIKATEAQTNEEKTITLTIAKAPLTVTADNKTKVYDGAIFPTADYTVNYSGFINGETTAVLGGTLTYTGSCQTATTVGSYTIIPSGLKSSNYYFDYLDGTLKIFTLSPTTSNILYVKKGGAGTKNGSSWANAADELARVLKWASYQPSSVTNNLKIYVAKGTYKPMYKAGNGTTDRDKAFVLVNGVEVYGGFPATGNPTMANRDWTANPTILSGDIDNSNTRSNGDAHHVVISVSDDASTVLDGFTISGGNANGSGSITVETKAISRANGGGMFNHSSSPSITHTKFSHNYASDGGGLYNNKSNPSIRKSTFTENKAGHGGGFYNSDNSSPTIINTVFSNNSVTRDGGAMYNLKSSSPTIINATFIGNTANVNGGAMLNYADSSPKIYNSIFWDNKKGTTQSATTVVGADIEGNSTAVPNAPASIPTVAHSLLQLPSANYTTTNNNALAGSIGNVYNQNPLFTNATNGDFSVQAGSPAINAGDNTKYNTATMGNTDKAGNPRIFDTTIDMGTYERQMKQQSITASDLSKTYGDADFAHGTASSGLVPIPISSNDAAVATIVNNKIHIKGAGTATITLSQAGNSTYDPVNKDFTLTVDKKALSVSGITADNKVYDGTTNATLSGTASLSGVVNADVVTLGGTPTAAFADKDVGTNKSVTVTYSLSGADAINYNLTQPNFTADITKAPLTVTADNKTKVYDGATYAGGYTVSYSGFVNGEKASDLGGTLSYTGSSQTATAVGSYTITPSGLSSNNYNITYVNGTLKIFTPNPTNNILYVKKGGAGTNDGSSWANATDELAHALKWASTQTSTVTNNLKIYVAKGTYKPMYRADTMSGANPNDLDNAFVLVNKVKLYGGFDPDNGITNLTHNRILTSAGGGGTILSGDTGNNFAFFHVVISVRDDATTVLDGFTITGGNASGSGNIIVEGTSINRNVGGGMFNYQSSPIIANTSFVYNIAAGYASSSKIYAGAGGGMINYHSSPIITNTIFYKNKILMAGSGAGMYNDERSSSIISNTIFVYNSVYIGGGGGMYNSGDSSSNPKIYNSIFWNNSIGRNVNTAGADINVKVNGSTTVKHCLTQVYGTNGTDGNIVGQDPNFVVPDENSPFSFNLRLNTGSPAINAGTSSPTILVDKYGNSITLPTKDLAGNPRIVGTIDMGAYERQNQKIQQTITASNLSKTYADADFVHGTASSGLAPTPISSSDTDVATIVNNKIHIVGVGTATITLSQAGNSTYDPAPNKTFVLTVNPKAITLTADAKTKVYGNTDPALTYQITTGSLKTGDALTGNLSRLTGENVGTYAINQGTLDNTNYAITYVSANLSITKADITGISFIDRAVGYDGTAKSLAITGTLPSGATVSYTNNLQTNIGTYSVTATINGGTNYNDKVLTANLTINNKPDITGITFSDATFAYDGSSKSLAIVGTLPIGTTVSYTNNGQTNIGTYSVTATINGGTNYNDKTLHANLSISKADITGITFENKAFSYDGTAKSLAIVGTLPSGATVSYTNNGKTNAGTYTVTATIDGGTNYNDKVLTADLTINKADITGITFSDATFTYDSSSKSLAIVGTLPSGTTVSYTNNGQTNAGTYSVTANINGGTNYNDKVLTANLTINNKPDITGITFDDATFTYDGSAKSLAIVGTLPSGTSVSYTNNGQTNIGTYSVTANINGGTNYNDKVLTANLTINKADITGITFSDATFTYDGSAKSLAIVGVLPIGTTVSYTNNGKTDAGTYSVTATINGGANYNDKTLHANLSINKADITGITFADATFTYDGSVKSLAIVGTLPSGTTVSYTNNGKTDAGTYSVTATIDGGTNYNNKVLTANLTINNKPDITGITFADATFTYDGSVKSLAIAGTLPSGATVSYTNNGKTNAGTYIVTANIDGGANYNDKTLHANLSINKVDITGITFADNSFTYDGSSKSLAIAGTLPSGTTVSYTNNGKTNAGTYSVTANIDGGTNYNDKVLTANLSINKVDITGITFANATFTYDGTVKSLAIAGTLPSGTTVSYTNNGKTNAGTYTVTATIDGGTNYNNKVLTANLSINKVDITEISFANATFTYDGTVKSLAIAGTLPSGATVSYTNNGKTNAGVYEVTAHITGSNYNNAKLTATLTIDKATQTIRWNQELIIGCDDSKALQLTAESSSGLPISYSSSNEDVARIDDDSLEVLQQGKSTITASQAGNHNYKAAIAISNALNYQLLSLVKKHWENVLFFDNSSKKYVKWKWFKNGEEVSGANKQYYSESSALSGNYYVEATDTSGDVYKTCPVDIEPSTQAESIQLYPNPVNIGANFTVKLEYTKSELQNAQLYIATLSGKIVQTVNKVTKSTVLQAPTASGIYVVSVQFTNGKKASANLWVK